MEVQRQSREAHATVSSPPWWNRRWFKVLLSLSVAIAAVLFFAGEYVLHHAEPILRKRIIETLSSRFDAPVELDRVDISLLRGIEVAGSGLRIPFGSGRSDDSPMYPMIAVQHFAFRTTFRSLLREPTRIAGVRIDGMEIHIPPPDQRRGILGTNEGWKQADPWNAAIRPKVAIAVDRLLCRDVKLFLESGQPGKDPLVFNISALDMQDLGANRAMLYQAQLTNPKPQGLIHAKGHFGPWAGVQASRRDTPDPGQTPLDGEYTFDHADLNTIRGIGGMLSSTGRFAGVLDRITIEGTTDVPDFSLDISDRPVPLHTEFHAIVDGTSGDTFLQSVHARLENSEFTTSGKVVKVKGKGHDIQLEVDIPHGRMQDLLRVAVKTDPPLIRGLLKMNARLHIPPGHERVPVKMEMTGDFHVSGVTFNNQRWQDQVDGLSARAQGRPEAVAQVSHDREAEVHSQLASRFTMGGGILTATDVHYSIPGAMVLLNGVYSMDGKLFEFKGHVRTDATASQMVTGWKSWLLKPADRFLKKNGAGVELPIEISGTQGDMHFGLAMHGTEEKPTAMLADVREKDRETRESAKARKLAALADEEDRKAAEAPTLQAAEQAHNAAVRHRAEAQRRALPKERSPAAPEH